MCQFAANWGEILGMQIPTDIRTHERISKSVPDSNGYASEFNTADLIGTQQQKIGKPGQLFLLSTTFILSIDTHQNTTSHQRPHRHTLTHETHNIPE